METNAVNIICSESPPIFWGDLLGTLKAEGTAVLVDPDWPEEWKQAAGNLAEKAEILSPLSILVPTSGSTGTPKFCIHTLGTLQAAAQGFREAFADTGIINAISLLPQHHIGGLMPAIRSSACTGHVHFADYRDARSIGSAPFDLASASVSVVPTQLRRMRESRDTMDLLRECGLILIGGAACPSDLLEWARSEQLRLAPCYGSTETSAMVTVLKPELFLKGETGVGKALPHAQLKIDEEGRIQVESESICKNYFPEKGDFSRNPLPMEDLGHLDDQGNLHVHGRADRVINTGGEKVHPEQVELAALASGLVRTAECRGIEDPEWGQRVELWISAEAPEKDLEKRLVKHLKNCLPSYAVPKAIHHAEKEKRHR